MLGDGGYLLELEKRGYVQAGPCTREVSLTHPAALAELHREFLHAGAEVLQALTFYASEDKLATVGLGGKVDEINRAATEIARSVAAEGDALVAGNLTLTWVYEPGDSASIERVRALFDRQLEVQMDVGIDLVICETFSYVGEAPLALERSRLTGLPVAVTMSYEDEPVSWEGWGPAECARRLEAAGDVVGANCIRNPEHTLPLVREMREAVFCYVAAQPTAYRTPPERADFTALDEFPFGLDPLQLTRGEMADYALAARDLGIEFIGSCCCSVACHVRAMAKALGKLPGEERTWRVDYDRPMSAYEQHRHTEQC